MGGSHSWSRRPRGGPRRNQEKDKGGQGGTFRAKVPPAEFSTCVLRKHCWKGQDRWSCATLKNGWLTLLVSETKGGPRRNQEKDKGDQGGTFRAKVPPVEFSTCALQKHLSTHAQYVP